MSFFPALLPSSAGLWDPYSQMHMGSCAELCAERFGFTREAQVGGRGGEGSGRGHWNCMLCVLISHTCDHAFAQDIL